MDLLNQLVCGMNKEEVRFFKLYTGRTGTGDRKDHLFFDYIRLKGDNYDESFIFKKLYQGANDKNSFYRLKNRLLEDVNKSLLLQHQEEDEITNSYHLLSRVKYFYEKRNFLAALHYLKKVEALALSIENYEILDIVYGEYIRLSHESVEIDPEQYIKKRKENYVQLNSLRQIDDVLAAVSYRVKLTQNFSEKENPILSLLESTVNDFLHDKGIRKSPKFQLSIYSAVSQVLMQRREYKTLEKYLLKTYRDFEREKIFNKSNHQLKLQMLTYIVNALFKNQKIKESLDYAEKLKTAMNEFGRSHYKQYLFFYYNSLVINYSVLNKDKAIALLEELKDHEELKKTPFYEIFVFLNLSVLWFDKKEYHKSIKELSRLYIHPNYNNADISLRFKIAIAELIIRFELGDVDFFENRVNKFEKDFVEQLEFSQRELNFVSLLKKMVYSDKIMRDKSLLGQIQKFISKSDVNQSEDSEIIRYDEWLKGKIQ